jgi:hypothetical protein
MADTNSNLTFTAAPVYTFISDVDKSDIGNQLDARISQLSALLFNITGEGFDSFNSMNDTVKHNYLWTCESLADECK